MMAAELLRVSKAGEKVKFYSQCAICEKHFGPITIAYNSLNESVLEQLRERVQQHNEQKHRMSWSELEDKYLIECYMQWVKCFPISGEREYELPHCTLPQRSGR